MQKLSLVLVFLAGASCGRRVQVPVQESKTIDPSSALATLLLGYNRTPAFNPSPIRVAITRPGHARLGMVKAECAILEGDEFLIAPSILSANFAKLGEEVDNVLAAGADVVHFDVMDNHYVPNLTIGPMVCKALRDHGVTAPIDVHLMVSPVDQIVEDFGKAGASYITFHPEASDHIDRTLQLIKGQGCKAGLVFNPGTGLDKAKYVLDKVDIMLLMSVNPGFGGQAFIDGTIDKVKEARKMIDESGYKIRLEIDGGVSAKNIKEIAEAGADMFVAGSAILKEPRTEEAYKVTIDSLREELASVKKGSTSMDVELEEAGEFGTTDYVMTFKSEGKVMSPWHDAPLELEGGLYNMLTEIPKMTFKKMEVDTKAEGNPIKQDEKKGKARLYHGPIFWNYGCLPQTWEDPNVKGDEDVGGAFGDNDPVDVVEIGEASLAMGSFTPVKVLGCLSMIDDGELDWKVIAINAADEHADAINDVDDIEKFYPGTVSGIREWFRWYKTPDDKPVNAFGHGEKALNAAQTKEVIKETNGHYKKLLAGETDAGKLWVPSK